MTVSESDSHTPLPLSHAQCGSMQNCIDLDLDLDLTGQDGPEGWLSAE